MKNKLLITALALLSAAIVPGVHASPVTYQLGDIILGFESTGGSTSGSVLEIDLGQYSNLGSFSSINLSSDLNAVFGPTWSNAVSYGAIGFAVNAGNGNWQNIYETTASVTPLPSSFGYGTTTSLTAYQTLAQTGTASYASLQTQSGHWSTNGVGVVTGYSANGAWSTFGANNSDFGITYAPGIETTIGSTLGLYDLASTSRLASTLSSTPYDISVSGGGLLSVSAVPEPSTYVLFGLGALVLIVAYRRKNLTYNS
jgi:hypothetical protein